MPAMLALRFVGGLQVDHSPDPDVSQLQPARREKIRLAFDIAGEITGVGMLVNVAQMSYIEPKENGHGFGLCARTYR